MNTLVKRGINAYRIFLKNKLAMAVMMLVSGVMMFVAGINGKGNDTLMMPLGITVAGAVFTFWSFYRLGFIKAGLSRAETEEARKIEKAVLTLQIIETIIYLIVAALGIFLLINQSFTDKVLNLMAGVFTTLNGVIGVTHVLKKFKHRDFKFWFRVALTLLELGFGIYFIFASDGIEIGWYIAMGALTAVAGVIEVMAAWTPEMFAKTKQDGKDILKIVQGLDK